jgi:hypothetical protein
MYSIELLGIASYLHNLQEIKEITGVVPRNAD